jgi:hypothetical protein
MRFSFLCRIVLRHLQLAIRNGEELNKLLSDVIISRGGVTPFIAPALLQASCSPLVSTTTVVGLTHSLPEMQSSAHFEEDGPRLGGVPWPRKSELSGPLGGVVVAVS